jgi:hypothetical protein
MKRKTPIVNGPQNCYAQFIKTTRNEIFIGVQGS